MNETTVVVAQINACLSRSTPIPSLGLENVVKAVVAAEDHRFFSHRGVDWIALARAIWQFVAKGKHAGGSTIEQQLVRTIRRRYEFTAQRKVSEIALAMAVARQFSKRDIVVAYLSLAYFGWQANGIVQAARRIGVVLEEANEQEAASLAALLKLPMPQHPTDAYRARLSRRVKYVLGRLRRSTEEG